MKDVLKPAQVGAVIGKELCFRKGQKAKNDISTNNKIPAACTRLARLP